MNVILTPDWTVDRFLAWEDKQERKYEFDGTRIIQMTGGSRNHQRIALNLLRWLDDALDPARFEVIQEMRTTNGYQVRYPDILVCEGGIGGSVRTLRDAVVIFEILSDDTADTDLNQKRDDYALLPGLRRYVLVEQKKIAVTIFERVDNGWAEVPLNTNRVALPEICAEIPVSAIYTKVRFE